jgi:hypothetical protein
MPTWLTLSALEAVTLAAASVCSALALAGEPTHKTERFDSDPRWDGLNHRAAKPRMIQQDFGYRDGKIGGRITIAGEPAYFAKKIQTKTFDDSLTASGNLIVKSGSGMALIGFFNAETANEWRARNSIVLRIEARGGRFFVHEEYKTDRSRAGSNFFTSSADKERGQQSGFASGETVHTWSVRYDPNGNNGHGTITATVDEHTTVTNLDPGHKLDGATLNRFGLLNVMKHADDAAELWIGDLVINGGKEDLTTDPGWDALHNRRTYETRDDRPYSDYGYSPTHFAGGKASGELGGLMFRGDIRLLDGINYYGDRLELLTLEKPLKASGKIVFRRGVSDSSALIGFFHVPESVTINPAAPKSPRSWTDYLPKNFLGVAIKGRTREGFFFHPTYRLNGDLGGGNPGEPIANCPRLNPDGIVREWSFEYSPVTGGTGQIKVTLDGQSATLDLAEGHQAAGARFNRFGIVSSWVDGNGQVVYLDDLTYTVRQE